MDFQLSFSEEYLSCPVCHDIFKHPVVLSCSHSFCKACLQEWWTHKKRKECPVCNTISLDDPHYVLVLKNMCETLQEKRLEIDTKEDAKESLKILQRKLTFFNEVKTNCDQAAEHIKVQAKNTERQMKEQFKKLHQFLHEEEEAAITALKEEEEQKSQIMKEKIEGLNKDISTLSNTIIVMEELRTKHISFLQDYKATVERVQLTLQDPQMDSGALMDEAKHLGNLAFRVWDKMKDIVSYTPVILDPNTANSRLVMSSDLTSVTRGEEQRLPDNPERFDYWYRVLGSEGFNSGTHSWDVEVGENRRWSVGVSADSSNRKGDGGGKLWRIMLFDGQYKARSRPGSVTILALERKPWRIRVRLDWNKGRLSFSDPDTNINLQTFTHTFTETLFPFIFNGGHVPLKVLQRKISVTYL